MQTSAATAGMSDSSSKSTTHLVMPDSTEEGELHMTGLVDISA